MKSAARVPAPRPARHTVVLFPLRKQHGGPASQVNTPGPMCDWDELVPQWRDPQRKDTFVNYQAQTHALWEHTCCQTRRWSAGQRCDRCGAQATSTILRVSIEDAMARLHSLEQRRVDTSPPRRDQPAAPRSDSAVVNPSQERLSAGRSASDERPPIARPRRLCQGDEGELPHRDPRRVSILISSVRSCSVCGSFAVWCPR